MRLTLIAGNWKMNMTNPQALDLTRSLISEVGETENPRVLVCPPFTALSGVHALIKRTSIYLGAQNMYTYESGAFTGEISPAMLLTTGVSYVILGHSERRQYFSETDQMVSDKIRLAHKAGLIPIVCIGEKLDDREAGKTEKVVGRQLDGSLDGLSTEAMSKTVIAYEPVWAIGTGKTATPEMAQDVHAFIRTKLKEKYGDTADKVTVLYGGSVNGDNAAGLLTQPDIDGALVGGASLKAEECVRIIKAV
jgi:triosephosphate isomerase